MAVQHRETSIKNKTKTPEELTAENKALTEKVQSLETVVEEQKAEIAELSGAIERGLSL